jgi:hypothetical protein
MMAECTVKSPIYRSQQFGLLRTSWVASTSPPRRGGCRGLHSDAANPGYSSQGWVPKPERRNEGELQIEN